MVTAVCSVKIGPTKEPGELSAVDLFSLGH